MNEIKRRAIRSVFTKKVRAINELILNNEENETVLCTFKTIEVQLKLQTLNESNFKQILDNADSKEDDIEKEVTVLDVKTVLLFH